MKYENQIIGDFIFTLGYETAKNRAKGSVDLLQQTPLDKWFGDLYVNIHDKAYILEFKKDEKEIITEFYKKNRNHILTSTEIDENIVLISKKCHFLIYIFKNNLVVSEYLGLNYLWTKKEDLRNYDFNKWLSRMVNATEGMGCSKYELKKYLSFLSKGSIEDESSSLIIIVNQNCKPIIISLDQGIQILNKLELDKQIEQSKSKNNGKGMEMGM